MIALALIGIVVFAVAAGSREGVLTRSLCATVLLVTIVPLYAAPSWLVVLSHVVGILLMLYAMFIDSSNVRSGPGTIPLVLLIGWDLLSRVRGASVELALYNTVLSATLVLAAVVVASSVSRDGFVPILKTFAFLLPVHFILAILEQLHVITTVWARGTWMDDIANRPQYLFTALDGRSMSTMGHAILLAVAAGVGIIAAMLLARSSGRRSYHLLTVIGLATLALSGTRSAVAALVIALSYYLLQRAHVLVRVFVVGGAIFAWMVLGDSDVVASRGIQDIFNSTSFTHRIGVLAGLEQYVGDVGAESIVVGVGANGYTEYFTAGVFGSGDGLQYFDNQVVRTFVVTGLIGLILLLGVVIMAFMRGTVHARVFLLFLTPLFFSFDIFTWQSSFLYLVIVIVFANLPRQLVEQRQMSTGKSTTVASRIGPRASGAVA